MDVKLYQNKYILKHLHSNLCLRIFLYYNLINLELFKFTDIETEMLPWQKAAFAFLHLQLSAVEPGQVLSGMSNGI